ncbi:hypothetical protein PVAG01_10624 [Phlyctema vagabunda]|uniref:Uncharacterized protein n=1 Tax=Phlyctema vagabunda TaxID=108571 RepID=A0ABR4P2U1_9HELO
MAPKGVGLAKSAQRYEDYIADHACRSQDKYLYCGLHFRGLSHLLSPRTNVIHVDSSSESMSAPFSHVVLRSFGQQGLDFEAFDGTTGMDLFHKAKYFRQQLHFLEDKDFYDFPPNPSNASKIWRIRVPTIFKRHTALSTSEIRQLRRGQKKATRKYLRSVNSVGQSLVRSFGVLDETTFILEQEISVYIPYRRAGAWTALIWLDSGSSLHNLYDLPWHIRSKSDTQRRPLRDDPLPIVRHIPAKHLSSLRRTPTGSGSDLSEHTAPDGSPLSLLDHTPQSLHHLPEQYGIGLNPKIASSDPFYALSELLFISASSETQLINRLEASLDEINDTYEGDETAAVENLSYIHRLASSHLQYIDSMKAFVTDGASHYWPQPQPVLPESATLQSLLIEDFGSLSARAEHLTGQLLQAMNFISNQVLLEESRKVMEVAGNTQRLTLLAFFFLPFTFTTSLFGTNFLEFGTGKKSIWILFATLVPVTILSTLLCLWPTVVAMDWKKITSFRAVLRSRSE